MANVSDDRRRAARLLIRVEQGAFASRLVEGDPLLVIELLLTWGYQYRPANPPDYTDGLVFVITG